MDDMDAAEEYREACHRFQAATKATLGNFLIELEELDLKQPAAQVRRLAIDPEKGIATGKFWHYEVWETSGRLSGDTTIPADLRRRLREFAEAIDPRYQGPGANNPP